MQRHKPYQAGNELGFQCIIIEKGSQMSTKECKKSHKAADGTEHI